jgi:gliding motility-associated-like protein
MGRLLQKIIALFTILTGSLLLSSDVKASHAMGADLTYECLGGNTYRIRVSFYRDCVGINAPNTVLVNLRSVTCGQNLSVTCTPIPGTGQEVTPLCPTALSSCNGGVYTGIQEWVYEGIITLPMQCTDWVFSYNLCCRNAAITNIANPNSNTFYIYATLNNTISPCNNSPTFSNKPVPFACLGQEFCFNHGAFDADGDSLVYSLITPYQNASTTVSYNSPFDANNPLSSNPPVSFNTATGDICMTPTNLEVTVMAVLVQEYRNGVLIGSVERDIQITVLNCNNNLPTLTGINGTNDFNATVCAGEQLCFFINSADADASQNVLINWDGSIPGATFTSTGGPRPTGNFCWTPSQSDISSNPYCFTVRVNDDACPMNGTQIYSYCITVQGINVNAGPDQLVACNDLATLNVQASGGTGNYTYLWSNGVTMPIQTVGAGTYIVTVSDGVCTNQDTVNVISAFEPTAAFTYSNTCPNTPIQFTDQSTLPGGNIISWNWNFGGTGTSTQQNPVHTFPSPGTYNVSLVIETDLGCIDTVVQQVIITPPPVPAFNAGTGCAGTAITFNNTTNPSTNVNWQWNFGNGQTSTGQNPSVTYGSAGTYDVTLIATDVNGCSDTLTQSVIIHPLPVPAFIMSAVACQGGPVTFTDNSTAGGGTITNWQWDFGNGQTSTNQNPSVTFGSAGNYNVSLTVTNSFGCSATIVQNIGINAPPMVSAGPNQSVCLGGSVVLTASGGNTYNWTPGGQTTNPITVTPSATTVYTVIATDANGCTASSNVTVTVNPLPIITVTPSQAVCAGQSATLTAGGGQSYNWNPTGNTTGTIIVTPGSSTSYAVTGTNVNGCSNTAFTTVTVNQNPVVNLSNVFVCAGSTTTLNAGNPGSTYNWSTGATSQIISVGSAGTYTVTVTNSSGCTTVGTAIASQSGAIVNTLQNASVCAGGSVVLDAGNPGNNYQWSTGQSSQTITVSNGGSYSVTITDANGCSGILSTTVNVNPIPVANFTPNDICINQPLQFNDISSVASGSIVSWNWDFGDGNVSQLQDPVHTYSSWGSYTVTQIVTSNNGCTDTVTRSFNVYPLPQANFSYNFSCVGEPIQFTDMSFTNMGNIIGWNWDFGDGTISTLQNPVHAFSTPGLNVVTLTVTTAGGCTDTRPRNIQIYPIPSLSFAVSQSGICSGGSVTITNNSTSSNGAINSWSWDFGNGQTSTQANPVVTFNTPGSYNISLIGVTSHGCADTISQPFVVYALPQADAGTNQSICEGLSVTLNATGGSGYLWSNGSTSPSITVSPSANTTYFVTVTDVNGCTGTDSVRVNVLSLPQVNAGPDHSVCAGGSVTLNGSPGSQVLWTPGAANTSSITVAPSSTTTYLYTVTASNGCTLTDTVLVTVNPLPIANAGPDQIICDGSTATLTATGGVSYLWTPGGVASQNNYVAPAVPTVYSVLVTDANGCTATDTVSVGINPVPYANLWPAFLCQGSTTVLDAGNPGSSYLWFPGGETTQTITVSDSGFYEVQITNAAGCVGVASIDVEMGGTGLVVDPVNVNICDGQTALLDANNNGSTYQWSNGATSQTISVSSSGTYTVTITDAGGCTASFSSNVLVNPLPQPAFSSSPNCFGAATVFQNNTTISSGNIISWNWDFGDGAFASVISPSHEFPAWGTYNVTLSAQTGMGCTANLTLPVTIYPQPVASFASSEVCEGSSTVFTDGSTVAQGTISNWSWNFGDGAISVSQNPTHIYQNDGFYTPTLIVTSAQGCSDTIVSAVEVFDIPSVQFSAQNVCEGNLIDFANGSSIQNGTISAYNWNFGDGNQSSLTDPSHMYQSAGTYNVSLIATTGDNCSAQFTLPVTVYPKPLASANAPSVCAGNVVQFANTSSVATGSIVNYYWNFGNGGSSNDLSPSNTFLQDGTYNTLLVVTSDMGCTDSLVLPVVIHPLPVPAFIVSPVCLTNVAQFNDQSTVSSGTINAWSWNFGDGSNSTQQNPLHTYPQEGAYQVSLAVTTDNGCSQSVTNTMNVFPLPVAAFASFDVCHGTLSQFFNQSTVPGGGILSCMWDFGDGSSSNDQDPTHTYTGSGLYNVTLTVTTGAGCTDTYTQQVTIYQEPVAAYTFINACDETPVFFTDQSTSADGVIASWNWDFGDGTGSSAADPFHIFPGDGIYPVTLTVSSVYGCTNSITDSVSVYALPQPVISAVSNCAYDPALFSGVTAIGDTAVYQYQWTFGDGSVSTTQSPVYQYQQPGIYNVTLTMININGCTATASMSVTVNPVPDAGFDASDACATSSVQFNNTSTISSGAISNYIWNFGDGNSATGIVHPVHVYDSAGVYTVTLIAVSDNGCTDTVSYQVTIHPLPVSVFNYSQSEGCGPLAVAFTDSSYVAGGSVVSWSWDFGNGTSSTLQNPVAIYTSSGTYGVSLTVTTDLGCTATTSMPNVITVYPGPVADFLPDPFEASILDPVINFNNYSQGGVTYNWTFGDGTGSVQFEPTHTYADTGTYVVTLLVMNSYGCIDTVRQTVVIVPEFTLYIPNAFTPNDDGVNDYFNIAGLGIVEVTLNIYNRWGENIYTSTGIEYGWDGTVQKDNSTAQQDVYVYDARVKDVFGRTHHQYGRVTLVR